MEILIRLDVIDEKFSKKIFEHLESIEKMNIQYSIKRFNENKVRTNGLIINERNREVMRFGKRIDLTAKEFDILFFLASYPGQVFTHRQIYEAVWEKEYFCDEGNVTAHIGRIRKKIEPDPRNPIFIQTVRGAGYKFVKK